MNREATSDIKAREGGTPSSLNSPRNDGMSKMQDHVSPHQNFL